MSDDLISRQAVIDYLESISNMDPKERGAIIFSVELLPSVQPKTGRWIDDCGGVKCSCCGYYIDDNYYAKNYCTNCGAKMEMR